MRLPDALERRELLYGRPKRALDHLALGKAYEEAGNLSDACEAYERVADQEARKQAILGLKAKALEAGNWFLVNRLSGAVPIEEADWRRVLDRALELGKLRYALRIARQLQDAATVERLERQLGIAPAPPPVVEEAPEAEVEPAEPPADPSAGE